MAFAILYSVVDEKGAQSTFEVNLPTATAFADVVTFAGSMAQLVNPLITGAITRIGVAFTVPIPGTGVRAAPLADSDVEEGARFQYRTAGGFLTALRLPTFNEAFVQAQSRNVDLLDVAVAPFNTAMIAGIAGEQPSDKREEDIVALDFAREQFQSSRSQV